MMVSDSFESSQPLIPIVRLRTITIQPSICSSSCQSSHTSNFKSILSFSSVRLAKLFGCNRPFPSCCEPDYEGEAKCKALHMKIRFVCISMKANFHSKTLPLALLLQRASN